MSKLGFYDRAILELIAACGEHTVVDSSALTRLHDDGLVENACDEWRVTSRGERVMDDLAGRG